MTAKLPNDRTFVDPQRKILDHWHGVFRGLEQLLKLSPADFVTLQSLIAAAQDAEGSEDGETDDIFALPIDNEPLASEDWFITYKNSDNAGRRVPMSLFPRSELISSTAMSGSSSINVTLPDAHPHAKIYIYGMSFSTTAQARIALSEDSGSTFLNAAYELFNSVSVAAADTANASPNITPTGGSGASAVFSVLIDIFDILGTNNKFVTIFATLDSSGSSYTGSYVFTSTQALNVAQLTITAGTFDAGTIEVWGMP